MTTEVPGGAARVASAAPSGDPRQADGEQRAAWRRRVGYLVAGGLGFAVDAAVLSALVHLAGWGPIAARGPSFLLAVSVTWLINRRHAFAGRRVHAAGTEYRLYFLVQVAGALANLAVFAVLIRLVPGLAAIPVLPLLVGAVAGLFVNYRLSCRIVFPQRAAQA